MQLRADAFHYFAVMKARLVEIAGLGWLKAAMMRMRVSVTSVR